AAANAATAQTAATIGVHRGVMGLSLYRSLGEKRRNPLADDGDQIVPAAEGDAGGFDRRADADAHGRRTDDPAPLAHRIASALHGHRDDRRLRLDRHDEAALLERQQLGGA